ncbi:MAG: UDP-N-acetylglucosamine 2-epimerase (non-hydrolyzing) [Chloroflexi bacterium]|nr:UDP-N-acetylglucosamine 2-epimerase (non-hydrolyzing) [Chloroflexota bacterium]
MKIVSIVGARPQFIKAAAVSRVLRRKHSEYLVHTGQHYDEQMSAVFFEELDIPQADINLEVGSGLHGAQTGVMLAAIEQALLAQKPDWALVYGDTNSTLAGALAAVKLHIPIAHVEAGLRSFNRRMPEEINRLMADHVSQLLLCPSQAAVENLAAEGIHRGVHLVGDVMADALFFALERARGRADVLPRLGLSEKGYLLATVHRAENTDQAGRLMGILAALEALAEPVIFPVHPRTRKAMQALGFWPKHITVIEPLGYLDMARLESAARMILTDSGGVQKEAYWLGVPCVTLREETEWVETVAAGWNRLAGAETQRILDAVTNFTLPGERAQLYGDGRAAERCVAILEGEG